MNKFNFESPILLLILVPIVALIVLISLKKRRSIGHSKIGRYLSMTLYLVAAFCVALIFSGFRINTENAGTSVFVLEDHSFSMRNAEEQLTEDAELLEQSANKGETVKRIVFANAAVPSDEASEELLSFESTSTDIANALYVAYGLFNQNERHRVILLSDGIETDGSAQTIATLLANKGVQIDALQYNTDILSPECEITGVEMPSEVVQWKSTRIKVTLKSNCAMQGKLEIYDEENLLREDTIKIKEGENTYTYRIEPQEVGMRVFSVLVEPDEDTMSENNKNGICVQVVGSSKILLVDGTGNESASLAELLIQNGYDVSVSAPKDAPRTAAAMCGYGVIVLMNVDAQDLPAKADEAFEQYVSTYGHSVLTTGGSQTYALGHMTDTAFESFLPVTMEVQQEESAESVALLLVIDNSASMSETATNLANDTATPCEMAKRGAIKSIQSLHDNDYVGVITFSDTYHILSPMTSVKEKEKVISSVSRMGTISGTAYCEAFQAAYDMLKDFQQADKRHVLFISDGNPSDSGYEEIVEQMACAGITTSVIGIGSYVNEDIMKNLAKIGGGYYNCALTAKELPALMLSDTVIQQAEYEVSGSFDVEFRANMTGLYHPTEGIKLSSYIRVTPKYNAQVLLSTEENEPLYVYWTSGNGKAAVMTSSLSGGNDSAYFTQNEGQKLLISMIEQLMPEESFADAFEVYITGGGSTCTLNVLCPTLENAYHVSVLLTTPMGNQYKLDLPQVRKHMFEKTISVEGYGKYACSLTVSDADYEIVCSHEAAAVLLWSPEYEAFPDEQQKNKLNEICALSGGVVYSDISALLEAEQTKQSIEYNPTNELVLIALFSVCLALFSRKLQDFKKHHIAR